MKKIPNIRFLLALVVVSAIGAPGYSSSAAPPIDSSVPKYSNIQRTSDDTKTFHRADIERVVEASKKAALDGNLEAQKFLFEVYRNGLQSFPKDLTEALKWVRMSAEQGDPDSQADLGTMFAVGAGATRDYDKARHWFLRAAENNNPVAQSNLGVIYQFGKGIPVDLEEAAKWFRRAAKAGNTIAKEQLDKVQRTLFTNMSKGRQDCFKTPECREKGRVTLIEADGDWFVVVDPAQNTLSLIVPKEIETPHFFRVIESRTVPKIYFGSDQEVSFEAVDSYTQVSEAKVSLSESPRHYRLQIGSQQLVEGFIESLAQGKRPILSILSDDYWAAAEFFHLSNAIIDYERRTAGRALNRYTDFLCGVAIPINLNVFSGMEKSDACINSDPSYQEKPVKLTAVAAPNDPFPRKQGKWSVEKSGDKVYVSVNGDLIDGDRLRIEFDKSCDLAHTFTSFHTTKKTPGMLEIKDQIASGIFGEDQINLKILFVIEVRRFRAAIVSLGWNDVASLKNYFEGRGKVSLKMLDDERFKSSEYLDLVENNWSLLGFSEALEYGQRLCRQRHV